MNPHEQSYSVVRLFVLGSTSAYTCLKPQTRSHCRFGPIQCTPGLPTTLSADSWEEEEETRDDIEPERGGAWTSAQRPNQRDPLRRRNQPPPPSSTEGRNKTTPLHNPVPYLK